jgi:rubrerythrin
MLEKPAQLLKVLKEAIKVEMDGYHFYQAASGRTRDSKGKAVFRSLAQDELDHKTVLEGLHKAIRDKTDFKFAVKKHRKKSVVRSKSPIFSPEFKRKMKEDHFELSVLRIGQLLETNSMEFYSKRARKSKHRDLKSLFNFLTEWEKDHLKALVQQERFLKGKF